MVAYHYSNVILVSPFKTRKNQHRLAAYNSIMQRLKNRGLTTDLPILDSEASKNYKDNNKDKWGVDFQLIPRNIHRINAAKRAVRTFKAHFLAVLSEVTSDFPQFLWDLLLVQTGMTLNFLCQSTFNRMTLAWEYFAVPFQYDATPLGPLGMNGIIHKRASQCHSWEFIGKGRILESELMLLPGAWVVPL